MFDAGRSLGADLYPTMIDPVARDGSPPHLEIQTEMS